MHETAEPGSSRGSDGQMTSGWMPVSGTGSGRWAVAGVAGRGIGGVSGE